MVYLGFLFLLTTNKLQTNISKMTSSLCVSGFTGLCSYSWCKDVFILSFLYFLWNATAVSGFFSQMFNLIIFNLFEIAHSILSSLILISENCIVLLKPLSSNHFVISIKIFVNYLYVLGIYLYLGCLWYNFLVFFYIFSSHTLSVSICSGKKRKAFGFGAEFNWLNQYSFPMFSLLTGTPHITKLCSCA